MGPRDAGFWSYKLQKIFCEAWLEGLSISQIPELLGVSRPTYYKLLNSLIEDGSLRIRFAPNLPSLGLRAVLAESRVGGVVDLGTLSRYSIIYIREAEAEGQVGLFRALGLRATPPLVVSRVYCPANRRVVAAARPSPRLSSEEKLVAASLTHSFTSTRETAERLGLSWQRIAWLLQQPKMRRALIAPLVYLEPAERGLVGATLEVDGPPSPEDVWELTEWPAVLLEGEGGGGPYLLLVVTRVRRLLATASGQLSPLSLEVRRALLSSSYPLAPVPPGLVAGRARVQAVTAQRE